MERAIDENDISQANEYFKLMNSLLYSLSYK